MPNWCYQTLMVIGDSEEVNRFHEAIKDNHNDEEMEHSRNHEYSLNQLYPCPQELAETSAGFYSAEPNENWAKLLANGELTQERYDELVKNNADGYAKDQEMLAKYGYKNWYDWQCANYGTKWGATSVYLDSEHDNSKTYKFDSAWSPADGLICRISQQFPKLVFSLHYTEESDAFAGGCVIIDGKIVAESDTPCDHDEMVSEHEVGSDKWYDDYMEWNTKLRDSVLESQLAMVDSVLDNLDYYKEEQAL